MCAVQWCPRSIHAFANVTSRTMSTYSCIVDLMGHKDLGGKVMLNLMDGLYGGPTEHPVPPVLFQTLGNWWSSSVFASQDAVALDSVAYDFLRNEPAIPYSRIGCVDNYMHEAAAADKPPSKTVYNPSRTTQLQSLGVHEHWNNAKDRKYTRNLGTGNGIEMIAVQL